MMLKKKIGAAKKHVFCCLLTGMLVLGAAYVLSVLWMYQQQDAVRQNDWRAMLTDLHQQRLAEGDELLRSLLFILSGNKELAKFFADRDRPGLLLAALAFERPLRQHSNITHFYFHLPDKTCFLRVHQPEQFGDQISRITLEQAAAHNDLATGLELGPLGTITLRAVMPWHDENGTLIGYLELGRELATFLHVFEELKAVDGYLLTVGKAHLDRQGWEQGMAMLGRPANWDLFPDRVVLVDRLPKGRTNCGQSDRRQGLLRKILPSSMFCRTFQLPLRDAGGREIGSLFFVRDELDKLLAMRRINTFFLLTLLTLASGLLFYYIFLHKLTDRLAESDAVLEESRRQLALALEVAGLGMWDWLPQSGELRTNDIFFTMLGYAPDAFPRKGQLWRELMHPEDFAAVSEAVRSFLDRDDGRCSVEYRLRAADGQWRWIQALGRVLARDRAGRAVRFMGVHIDITRSKEAEAELTEHYQRLTTFMETLPDAAFLKDGAGRWLLTNAVARKLFHVEQLPWQGRTDAEIGQTSPALEPVLASCVASDERAWQKQAMLIEDESALDHTGQLRLFEVRKMPLFFPNGRRKALVVIGRDVTERRKMEQQLIEARQAAEAASQAKSNFLANMSHEIRTPMNAVIGMARLALETPLTSVQRNYIQTISTSAELLLGILNDILDFSKIEAGKMELEQIDFSLRSILDGLRSLLAFKAAEQGLDLLIEADSEVPDSLRGDPLRLSQILINLGNNAVKFTQQGSVCIRVELVDLSRHRAVLHFSVSDTGIGMTQEEQQQLFQLFSQADNSITRRYGGTGLGLAICKKLVELLGGAIGVESVYGQGSVFSFTVPLALGEAAVAQKQQPAADTAEQLRGAQILLAEDNEINQELTVALLRRKGVEVTVANNGAEALELLRHAKFDCVLMDIQMPVMDGYTACREIRRQPQHKNLPVIALTANVMTGDQEKSREAGMNGHVGKPFKEEELLAALGRVIGTDRRFAAQPPVQPQPLPDSAFAALVGIDVDKGLANTMHDQDFYRRILCLFQQDQADFAEKFATALRSGDLSGTARLAHTLKGVAGTIGASALHEAASQLETCCRQSDTAELLSPLQQTTTELDRVLTGIRTLAERG